MWITTLIPQKQIQIPPKADTLSNSQKFILSIPDTPSVEMVYYYLRFFNVRSPEIVLCQSLLETARYKEINNKNNLFNFTYSKKYSIATGVNKTGYAMYKHWIHSVLEYRNWQRRKYTDTTENYYHFLHRVGFAEDTLYNYKLKIVLKKNKQIIDSLEQKYLRLRLEK